MARVSITKAARLAGVNRGTLYKTYINKGVISVSADEHGKKFIDTSELLRVFGSLQSEQGNSTVNSTGDNEKLLPNTGGDTGGDTAKDVEIKLLREQLAKAEQREGWLHEKIDTLTDTVKLLEDNREVRQIYPRLWWQFWK